MKKSENEKNRITNITELLTYDREHRITVISVRLKASVSMSMPAGEGCHYIAMKESGLSAPERYTALLHETGHCETGAFYNLHSPFDLVDKQEYRANKWAVENAITKEALEQAAGQGYTEAWQLAEYFGVTEDFIRFAYRYYYGD